MQLDCDLTVSFTSTGNSLAYLGGGWARCEPTFTWGIGVESHLVFPSLKPADEYVLTLDVIPFIHVPETPSQRLIVSINDAVVGSCELSRPTLLGYRIPAGVARGAERMVVTLRHPDAVRPKDFGDSEDERHLAFALSEAKLFRVLNAGEMRRRHLPAGLMLGAVGEPDAGGRT